MATIIVPNTLAADLAKGVHQFHAHVFKLVLSNSVIDAADAVLADITQLSTANGYTAGGATVANVAVAGTPPDASLVGDAVELTASGAGLGPFRYWSLINDSVTGKRIVASWDNGSSLTIPAGTAFRVRFSGVEAAGEIFKLDV